jgi:TonB-linked SusC/RagA family outer membrane protein
MKKILIMFVLALATTALTLGQAVPIRGTITSSDDGLGIPGVTITVKGTTLGVLSDADGKYSITVPNDAAVLLFSYIGMKKQEIEVKGKTVIDVVLQPDQVGLDEVVVTAYGTSSKGAFTGSASVLKSENIEKRQVSNVTNALVGAVAGVQILSANGQPGTSATVRVRGVGSINAGSDPLYVIDGVPFDGDMSSINSADIASMTVLKDAASTALYGSRGANGIIMITTKKGVSGKSQISFDAKTGVNSRAITNYSVLTSPKDYIETEYQAIYNAGLYNLSYTPANANIYANNKITTDSEGGSGYQVYTVPSGEALVGADGKLNPNATLGYSDGKYYYTPDNWSNEMFKHNKRQEYNLSMTGADSKYNYYLSLGYLDDQGVISGSGFTRISARLKGDYQMKKWLNVGANVNYINATSNYPSEQTSTTSSGNAFYVANNIAPIYPLYVRDATTHAIMLNNGRKLYDYGDGKSTNFSRTFMSIANPAGDLIYNKRDYLMDILNTTLHADLTPVKGLKITAQYGLNLDNTIHKDMGNAYMGQSAQYGGTAWQQQTRTSGFDQQYIAFYQFDINHDHQFDITVGYDGYTYQTENVWGSAQNLYNPENYYLDNAIDNLNTGGSKDTYSTEGIFGRLNYSFKDKYFGNVSYRRDASSRFSPDNRWGDFYSGSAAWMINKENFLAGASWIDMLKLKASYGQQGNDAIGNYYAWLDQYKVTGSNGVFSDGTLIYKGNPDLTWETSVSYNVGVDFAFFRNKISGSIEYFGRRSSDMLYNKPVAGSLGYTSIPMNVGSMTNSGVEIDLTGNVLKTEKLTWDIFANATLIKNKINKLHPDLNGQLIDGTRIYEEGQSMYRMYLVDWAGVDATTGKALYWAKDSNNAPITTDDYTVAQKYKVATDDLLPKVYGGFGTSIDAYGFDLSVQFSYQLGGRIYDSGYAGLMHGGTSTNAGNNWHTDIHKAWTPTNTNTDVPRLDANDLYANSTSTRFLISSNYLSFNNFTVGYTIPSEITQKLQIEKIRVFFVADNIGLISSRKGLDPRQSFISATTALYTPIRTVSGGINLTF